MITKSKSHMVIFKMYTDHADLKLLPDTKRNKNKESYNLLTEIKI